MNKLRSDLRTVPTKEIPNILRNLKISLPYSQNLATGHYPGTEKFSPQSPIQFL